MVYEFYVLIPGNASDTGCYRTDSFEAESKEKALETAQAKYEGTSTVVVAEPLYNERESDWSPHLMDLQDPYWDVDPADSSAH